MKKRKEDEEKTAMPELGFSQSTDFPRGRPEAVF